ncbi:MAG TPA: hypothetical protein VHP11_17405, partial [Tepidisphaeraceae bacterium]|nr:hypothetical protein [Tepidisphaeraceae bacterium]
SSLNILIRTTAPADLFHGIPRSTVHPPEDPIDFGVVEHDALAIDVPATWTRITDLLARSPQIIARERAFVETHGVDLILTDIAYLPGEVAHAAGIRCLAISNFTWEWIYASYVAGDPTKAALVEQVHHMYAKMEAFFRLPFGHATETFPRVLDVPLVVNHPQWDRQQAAQHIGLDPADPRPRILIGMRGGVSNAALRAAVESNLHFLFLSTQPYPGNPPEHFRLVKLDGTLDFTDLLSACHAVISKLGYGTIAECIACQTAILWPPRTGFPEQAIMEQVCPQYLRMRQLPLTDYQAGHWAPHLQALLAQPAPPQTMNTNGAQVCAAAVLGTPSAPFARPAVR